MIKNNTERKDKSLWTDKGTGNCIHFREFDNAYEEGEYIAGDIKKKKRELISDYHDCAVLYRTNAQSRILEENFVALNIPYNIVGGVNFYARKEIKDILAYLKTIDNGKDDLAVKRIINVPRRGIGAASITKVQGYADNMGISFFEALERVDEIPSFGKGKAAEKLKSFELMIRMFRTKLLQGNTSLEDLITDVIETTGYVQELEASDEEDAKDRIENIDELITKLVTYEMEKDTLGEEATLSGFLEEVALVADIDSVNRDDNKVLLMTVHSAKGLEFPQVYLSGLEDGVFPSYMTITSDDPFEVEEERRLAYVGITRAKDDLTVTYAKSRMIRGQTQYNRVSRFVSEIPVELMDNRPTTVKRYNDEYEYEEDSYQKNIFKTKPFQSKQNHWLEAAAYLNKQQNPSTAKLSDTVFDIQPSSQDPSEKEPVQTVSPAKKNFAQIVASKPKAVVKKKETPSANKPYIAKSLDGLTKGIPAMSSEELGYGTGDRVTHVKYGEGTVLDIVKDTRDFKVTVNFDAYGNKIMYAAFAKLKKC